MLQKLESPLDLIARLPASRALAAARERHAAAVRLEEVAAAEFRTHCKRVGDEGRWPRNDRFASDAEAEAIKAGAAARLAATEAETVRRAHGESLNRHLAKYESAVLENLLEELRSAHVTARRIAKAAELAQRDGASPPHGLTKCRRIERELSSMLARFK